MLEYSGSDRQQTPDSNWNQGFVDGLSVLFRERFFVWKGDFLHLFCLVLQISGALLVNLENFYPKIRTYPHPNPIF